MYGHHIEIRGPFGAAIDKVTAALKAEGFGVLSDIDVQKAMKEKLGVEMPGYRILGACNPPLAHRAIQAEPEIGLLLPCNVTVRDVGNDRISVGFLDANMMADVTGNAQVQPVAVEAAERLARVRDALSAAG